MAYIVRVTHKPSNTVEHFGPWPTDDPGHRMFSAGWGCGVFSERFQGNLGPADLDYEFIQFDQPDAEVTNLVGTITAEASATVRHPDGTED